MMIPNIWKKYEKIKNVPNHQPVNHVSRADLLVEEWRQGACLATGLEMWYLEGAFTSYNMINMGENSCQSGKLTKLWKFAIYGGFFKLKTGKPSGKPLQLWKDRSNICSMGKFTLNDLFQWLC